MLRTLSRILFLAAVVLASWHAAQEAKAVGRRSAGYACEPYSEPNQSDLFGQYYIGPGCGTAAAQMYPAPMPTPPLVGHTFYTYQPFYPQEWLYHHHRTYRSYYDNGRGMNRTKVYWW